MFSVQLRKVGPAVQVKVPPQPSEQVFVPQVLPQFPVLVQVARGSVALQTPLQAPPTQLSVPLALHVPKVLVQERVLAPAVQVKVPPHPSEQVAVPQVAPQLLVLAHVARGSVAEQVPQFPLTQVLVPVRVQVQ